MDPERFVHYTTGFAEIDTVHFALLTRMFTIQRMCRAVVHDEEISAELLILQSELNQHYIDEEALMIRLNYAFLNAHRAQHVRLRARMEIIIGGPQTLRYLEHIVGELHEILVKHIDNDDMQIR